SAANAELAFCVFFKEFNGVADRQDGLGSVIGDLTTEFFLERHDEFNRVEAVGPEIVDEARVLSHLFGFDAQMFHDDLFHPLANIPHRCNLGSFELGSIGQRPRAIAVWACVVSAVESSGRERTPCDDWNRDAAPAKPKLGYHTSNALTSMAPPHRQPPRGRNDEVQIIAIPPFTCSVWPVM